MILTSFHAALRQFVSDKRFRTVLWRGIGLALVLLLVTSAVLIWGADLVLGKWIDKLANRIWGRDLSFGAVLGWALLPVTALLSGLMMVPVASLITSFYLDRVASAVEERHYPDQPAAQETSFVQAIRDTLGFLWIMILANLIALLLYIILSPLAPIIFWGVNGYLLGREYFTMAAARHLGKEEAKRRWRKHMPLLWTAGVLMVIPLSIPVLALAVPVLAAATFTHLHHAIEGRRPARRPPGAMAHQPAR